MPFVRSEEELSYSRELQDAIDMNMEAAERDQELHCWFLEKPYTSTYLMRGDSLQTQVLEFESRPTTAVFNSIFRRMAQLRHACVSFGGLSTALGDCARLLANLRGSSYVVRVVTSLVCLMLQRFWRQHPAVRSCVTLVCNAWFTIVSFVCFI